MTIQVRPRAMDPLREEHRELLPEIARLGEVADGIGRLDDATTWAGIAAAHDFLANHLLPHAAAEEAALYPAVDAAMAAPGATRTMSRDHEDVLARVRQLGRELDHRDGMDPVTASRLRAELYGLEAVVSLHFAKEEEIYLPLLDDTLGPDEAASLFERLEAAAEAARG